MCGRYAASRRPEDLAGIFGIEKWEPEETLEPDYNVAPTKEVLAVLDRVLKDVADPRPVRQLRKLKWGLVPSWSKTPEGGARMINARAETVHEKPSFRRAFAQRRCILPADGSVFAMAGLYEFWRDRTLPDDHPQAWWVTCSVITTEAESDPLAVSPADGPHALAEIHPRMPLMLTPDRWDAWLDPARTDVGELRELLAPPHSGLMRAYPVGTAVSNVRNNGPELLKELAAPEEGTLF